MATTVKIIEYGTPNELILNAYQRKLFLNELRRVQGTGISVFFKNLFARKGIALLTGEGILELIFCFFVCNYQSRFQELI